MGKVEDVCETRKRGRMLSLQSTFITIDFHYHQLSLPSAFIIM